MINKLYNKHKEIIWYLVFADVLGLTPYKKFLFSS